MRTFVFIVLHLVLFGGLRAQKRVCEFTCRQQRVLQSIIELNPLAVEQVRELKKSEPLNLANEYLDHYYLFIRYLAFSSRNDFDKLIYEGEELLERWEVEEPNDWAVALKADINFHLGIAHAMEDNKWQSIMKLLDSHSEISEAIQKRGEQVPFKKLNALFLIMCDQVPDGFDWLLSLLKIHGNSQQGFRDLDDYVTRNINNPGLYEEALFFQEYVQLKFDHTNGIYPDARVVARNPIIQYLQASIALKDQQPYPHETLIKNSANRFPLLNYVEGKIMLNNLNDSCRCYFDRYLHDYKGLTFRVDTHLRQYWARVLFGHGENLEDIRQHIESTTPMTSMDRQAKREAEWLPCLNVELLKARLVFDGGQYSLAKDILVKHANDLLRNNELKEEYYYRMARSCDKSHDFDNALIYYHLSINEAAGSKRYFGAKAAYYLARIYYSRNEMALAKQALLKCDELNDGEYQNEIESEAKQLFSRIEKGKG